MTAQDKTGDPQPSTKPRVQSAARTVELLRCVALAPSSGISAKALSEALGLPRQVVYHLIHTLLSMDMLRRVGGSSYALGLGVAPLAAGFNRQLANADVTGYLAQEAAIATGETSYVSGWLDGEIVLLSTAKGSAPIHAAQLAPGTAGNAHARASGKLLLAMIPEGDLDRYLERHELQALTQNTLTTRASLKAALAKIREGWIATDEQEFALGLSCLAVPLGAVPSQLVIGLSAPTERFNEMRDVYIGKLLQIAHKDRFATAA